MNALMVPESRAVRQALEASEPRWALRAAVREILRRDLLSRTALIAVLEELADEYEEIGREDLVPLIAEVLDVLEGQISDHGLAMFFDGIPVDQMPRKVG